MVKTIIKELIIILLILIAIILGLGVLLYDYIPSTKIVPTVLQYETQENITQELSEKITNETEEVIITYEVDSKDLNIYEKLKDYNAGNPNPFSYFPTNVDDDNNTNTTNNSSNNTNNKNTNNNSNADNNTNNGTFFKDTGTK